MKRLPLIIGGGAVVVLAAGYFGLSAYSSNQAQKHLEDWVYEMELEDTVHWRSVSASPLGGKITINNVVLESKGSAPLANINKVTLTDLINDEDRSRLRIQLQGVDVTQEAASGLSFIGQMVGGGLGRLPLPSISHGVKGAQPFDMQLFVDVDDTDGVLENELSVTIPKQLSANLSYRLEGQRGLNRQLRRLPDQLADAKGPFAALQELSSLAELLKRADIEHVRLTFKDQGAMARNIALQKRYNTPLDPEAGSAEKQRNAYYEREVAQSVKRCESSDFAHFFKNGCELLSKVLLGKENGIELTINPKEPVRIQDLSQLDNPRRAQRLVERLNMELSSY